MKVFISWSGEVSKAFATEVKWWLGQVLHPIEPWMSDSDISPGDRSLSEIEDGLNGAQFGILCVTRENQTSPWLNFEAGAISKEVNGEKLKVVPIMIDMTKAAELTQSTISQFQAIKTEREDFDKLAHTINRLSKSPRKTDQLDDALRTYWDQFKARLEAVPAAAGPVKARRDTEDMIEETLEIVRGMQRDQSDLRRRTVQKPERSLAAESPDLDQVTDLLYSSLPEHIRDNVAVWLDGLSLSVHLTDSIPKALSDVLVLDLRLMGFDAVEFVVRK